MVRQVDHTKTYQSQVKPRLNLSKALKKKFTQRLLFSHSLQNYQSCSPHTNLSNAPALAQYFSIYLPEPKTITLHIICSNAYEQKHFKIDGKNPAIA